MVRGILRDVSLVELNTRLKLLQPGNRSGRKVEADNPSGSELQPKRCPNAGSGADIEDAGFREVIPA